MKRNFQNCKVCHKPLGARRSKQGVAVHPQCRGMIQPEQLEAPFATTAEMLKKISRRAQGSEIGELFEEASVEAERLLKDLRSMRNYIAPSDKPANRSSNNSAHSK